MEKRIKWTQSRMTYDNAEVYKHVEYPQQTLMAPWLNDDSFDDKKMKDEKEEMLRYEDGKKKCPSARFSHLHLPGLGVRMMAASKDFSIGDTNVYTTKIKPKQIKNR